MAQITLEPPPRHPQAKQRGAEFMLYFWLIFLLVLPWSSIRWINDIFRLRTLNLKGPLARAWAEADRTTPLIFSA